MGQIDPEWVQILLTILVGFSSLTFFFIRVSLRKLADEILSQKLDFEKTKDEFSKKLNSLEISIAILRTEVDHFED